MLVVCALADESGELETIPADPAPVADAAGDATPLTSMVVTATKREESLREIAGSIFALSGAELERMGAREQVDFVKLAPGVSLFKGEPNQHRISIRGIAADYGTAQSTGILIGEVPFTDPFVADQTPDLSPFDLQTVEILKGPQGTLFGASGLGGTLRYVVQPARPGVFEIKGTAAHEAVRYGQGQPLYGTAVNVPLGESFAFRFVGAQRDRPGVVDELARGETDVDRAEQQSSRALVRYLGASGLDVQAIHLRQDTSIADLGFVENLEGRLERDSTALPSPVTSDFRLDGLTLAYDLGWAELVSVTGSVDKRFATRTDTSRLVPATLVDGWARVDGYTQELRLLSPQDDGPWQWLAGAFVQRYANVRRVDLRGETLGTVGAPLPGVPYVPGTIGVTGDDTGLIARYDLDAIAREQAVFLEATRTLGDRWSLTTGLRGYRTESEGVATASGPLNVALSGESESRNDAGIREQGLNPKLAVEYRPADDLLFYVLAARGFRFGGVSLIGDTPTDDVPETYRSDHIWLYEGGLRSGWLRGALLVDGSVYRIDWTDPQLTQLTDSGLLTYTDNAGGARVLGADLALEYRTTAFPGLVLAAGLAYTDARTSMPFEAASGAQVREGSRWPFTPVNQSVVSATYEHGILDWDVRTTLLQTHTGGAFGNIENTVPVFDYRTFDAHVQVSTRRLPALRALTIGVTNLADERGIAGRTDAGDVRTVYYERPRTATLQLLFVFGEGEG